MPIGRFAGLYGIPLHQYSRNMVRRLQDVVCPTRKLWPKQYHCLCPNSNVLRSEYFNAREEGVKIMQVSMSTVLSCNPYTLGCLQMALVAPSSRE